MKTVYILCNSENEKSGNYIQFGAAGSSMSKYLASSIGQCDGMQTQILNLGSPSKKTNSISKTQIYDYNDYKIVEFKSLSKIMPGRIRAKKVLREAIRYLKQNIKSGDIVLIYHSLYYSTKYKKILEIVGQQNTILFVAEIYTDVLNKTRASRKKELEKIRMFDKFICMSNNLSKLCCSNPGKKSILLFGSYSIVNHMKNTRKKNRVDIVYSGTTSKTKNGLYMAIDAMEYLGQDFVLHVYCQPTKKATEAMIGKKNVVYEGYINESLLNEKLCNYDIGLAPQDPSGIYNTSSFPSKIIKYLSCGLSVISSASVSVLESPFSNYVNVFDKYDPKVLSESIIKVSKNLNSKKNTDIIEKMDQKFKSEVITLIEG